MKYILLFAIVLLFSTCTKQNIEPVVEVQKPILIKVEAEHIDGEIVNSPIILVR
jgi:hypothetical protein